MRVEVVLRTLGLASAADTMVGSATVRGVSGGERKRVTSAEMLVGPKVCCSMCLMRDLDEHSALLCHILIFIQADLMSGKLTAYECLRSHVVGLHMSGARVFRKPGGGSDCCLLCCRG